MVADVEIVMVRGVAVSCSGSGERGLGRLVSKR